MNLITINDISVKLAGREIFHNLSWVINANDRVGLIGPNGAGKSTLLKIITGAIHADAGTITRVSNFSLGYLHQHIQFNQNQTLLDVALDLPPKLAMVEKQLLDIEKRLENPEIHANMDALSRILDQQANILALYDYLEVDKYPNRVEAMLTSLGFSPTDFDLPAATLSGGQKKMVALAKLALEKPDLLLLDEPDNHLDLRGKRYLESFINNYKGAIVIVSHDRYLLDEVVSHIAELENGQLELYAGNYSAYKTEKEIRRLRQQQLYIAQQKEITRIEEAIKRFEHWAHIVVDERHIKQARSRRKMLERMEEKGEIIQKVTEQKVMDIQLQGWRGSNKAIELVNVGMSFGENQLFKHINLQILHGQRTGLVGANGAGKSVLFKIILEQIQSYTGQVNIGPSTKIGYYAQEHQALDGWWDRTPLELIRHTKPMTENAAVAQLVKFAFIYEQIRGPIKNLSGGERSRLQLLVIMLTQPNCLLLDEPTNNLDIASMEVLEHALDEFDGALIIISHDRYFLDQTVDKIVELDRERINEFEGGYTDYQISCQKNNPANVPPIPR